MSKSFNQLASSVFFFASVAVVALCSSSASHAAINWNAPSPLNSNASSDTRDDMSPRLAGNGAGTWISVWVSDSGQAGGDKDIYFARSVNNGATWSAPAPLNTNAATDTGNDLAPEVAWDGGKVWLTVWSSNDTLGGTIGADYDILFSRSTDDGVTWSAPAPLNTNASADTGDDVAPRITTDHKGGWVAVWSSNDSLGGTIGTEGDILYARSTDHGVSWSAPAPLNANAATDTGLDASPQVVTDGAGTWITVWRSNDSLGGTVTPNWNILYSRSTDKGATWSFPAPVFTNPVVNAGFNGAPRLDTDGRGTWIAVWSSEDTLGGTIGPDRDILFSRSSDSGLTWTAAAPLNSDAATDTRGDYDPQVRSDGKGNWAAVWYSTKGTGSTPSPDVDIYHSTSTDNGATWSAIARVNTNAATDTGNDFAPAIATDSAGNWISVWESSQSLGAKNGGDWNILTAKGAFTGACRGGIRDAITGQGVGCATLIASTGPGEQEYLVATDVNGQYVMDGLPEGSYTIKVYSPGYIDTSSVVSVGAGAATLVNFPLNAAPLTTGVAGAVTDQPNGEPLLGVKVTARTGQTVLGFTYTCASGRYELLGLPAKASSVTLDFTSTSYETKSVNVNLASNAVTQVDAVLTPKFAGPGAIAGVVTNFLTHAPIADARVTLSGRVDISATTDSKGVYAFAALPEGVYTVHASATGFQGQTTSTAVAPLETQSLDLALRGGFDGPGDINADQTIDAVDVQLVINAALQLETAYNCDIDGSGTVDAVDIQIVINSALGVPSLKRYSEQPSILVGPAAGKSAAALETSAKGVAPVGTIYWVSGEDSDGNWNNPANWSTGVLPGANDIVVISRPGLNLSISFPNSGASIKSLICDEDLTISDGSLTVNGSSIVTGSLSIKSGGVLGVNGAGVIFTASGSVALDGATLSLANGATLSFPHSTPWNNARIVLRSGSSLDLSMLTAYTWSQNGGGIIFDVDGAGSSLTLPNVTTFTLSPASGWTYSISATNGGHIDLSSLVTIATPNGSHLNIVTASGGTIDLPALSVAGQTNITVPTGVTLSLPALTALNGTSFNIASGAAVNLPSVTSINGAGFTVSGAGALNLPALSSLTNVYFVLRNGAVVNLPTVTSYTWTIDGGGTPFDVDGTGSHLGLSGVTSFAVNPSGAWTYTLSATNSGLIDLSGLKTITSQNNARVNIVTAGAGAFDFSALNTVPRASFNVPAGCTINLPALTSTDGDTFNVTGSGILGLPALSSLISATFVLRGGAVVNLPSVTSYTWTQDGGGVLLDVDGTGSHLGLPGVVSLALNPSGAWTHVFSVTSGGQIDLSGLQTITTQNNARANFTLGNGGSVSFTSLSTAANTQFTVPAGCTLSLPALTSANGDVFSVAGSGILSLSALPTLTNAAFVLRSGAVVNLPSVTSFTWTLDGGGMLLDVDGASSHLGLPNVTAMALNPSAGWIHVFSVTNSGQIDLSALQTLTTQNTAQARFVSDSGGNVSLSALGAAARTTFAVSSGSTVSLPSLTTTDGDTFSVSGSGILSLSALPVLTNAAFILRSGAVLNLPSVTSYMRTADGGGLMVDVDGAGSHLGLPNVTAMAFNPSAGWIHNFSVTNNGQIDLSGLQTITTQNAAHVNLVVDTGGAMNLAALATAARTTFAVSTGSTLNLPALATTNSDTFSVSGAGVLGLPALSTLTNASFYLRSGAVLNLPSVTAFNWSQDGGGSVFDVGGAGSQLSLPNVTTFTFNPSAAWAHVLAASDGGHITLPATQTITTQNNSQVIVSANGTNSQIDLSVLATFNPVLTTFVTQNGGVILKP